MKFMLIMRGTDEAYAAYKQIPFEQIINEMGAYNESMMSAGVLVAGDGLAEDMSQNFVVTSTATNPSSPTAPTARRTSCSRLLDHRGVDEGRSVEWARERRSSRATRSRCAA